MNPKFRSLEQQTIILLYGPWGWASVDSCISAGGSESLRSSFCFQDASGVCSHLKAPVTEGAASTVAPQVCSVRPRLSRHGPLHRLVTRQWSTDDQDSHQGGSTCLLPAVVLIHLRNSHHTILSENIASFPCGQTVKRPPAVQETWV